ncbi:type IV pilus secretin PilQ [Basfia succiniciproducens]|uniref:Type II secretion system protein D (GspD) n=1 Tax=Basfia succiniciproducens TaxID=653940 RepID=A0A1G5D2E5_9PAST|nr:type IV pilus secretin PilQ [Basfia succiniciproducens]QIM69177.1 secretin [Basfia succiniciproducens]SCY08812.1 type II secretion system protein D (GspD) [Basfia succiniciproducens]SEP57744.1 type II secretion system protein D (GspD) [Basfia succiniciproducens]
MESIISFGKKCGLFFGIFISSAFAGESGTFAERQFSIHLKKAPLVATLQQLALEQNANLVIDDELEGTLSLKLEKVNLERLFHSVAKLKNLSLHKDKDIYYFTKNNLIEPSSIAGELKNTENFTALSEPNLVSTTVKLHFAKASEVMKSLTSGTGSLLSPVGSVSFDERSNQLLIQDDRRSLQNIKNIIAQLDKPIEQIAIEARIVTMNDESLKELGVRWGLLEGVNSAHRIAGSLEANGFADIGQNLNVNFPTSATPAGSVALQVAKIHGRLLDLELTALEQENNVKIIASPRLLTTNKKSASIKQGTEIPYVAVNRKNDTEHVEFREAVLGLEVTPHISKDNSILLDLIVSQNSPGANIVYGNGNLISIDKQEINTQVFAKDGETIVLGGVFNDTITKSEDKVPILGDIPLIKHLFSKESEKHQKRELVIFVTPHILKQGESLEQIQKRFKYAPKSPEK